MGKRGILEGNTREMRRELGGRQGNDTDATRGVKGREDVSRQSIRPIRSLISVSV